MLFRSTRRWAADLASAGSDRWATDGAMQGEEEEGGGGGGRRDARVWSFEF